MRKVLTPVDIIIKSRRLQVCLLSLSVGHNSEPFTSLHFTLFTQQLKIQMQCVQYATYNSLGGCSKARSALTTVPSNGKQKKLVRIKYSKKAIS